MGFIKYSKWIDRRADELRRYPTPIEKSVWKYLSRMDVVFEFQKVIGHCIVDFFLPTHGIVIECDGAEFHKDKVREDTRDNYLEYCGYRILHLPGWICKDTTLCRGRIRDFMEQEVAAGNK